MIEQPEGAEQSAQGTINMSDTPTSASHTSTGGFYRHTFVLYAYADADWGGQETVCASNERREQRQARVRRSAPRWRQRTILR